MKSCDSRNCSTAKWYLFCTTKKWKIIYTQVGPEYQPAVESSLAVTAAELAKQKQRRSSRGTLWKV